MKSLTNIILLSGLLALPFLFSACKPEVDPDNVITDDYGLRLDIMWFNDTIDPTVGTSISMNMQVNSYNYYGTGNFHSFGNRVLGVLQDGTYDMIVKVDAIDRPTRYVISLTGQGTGRNIWQELGPLDKKDLNTTFVPAQLEVSGNKYTFILK